jgi:hypothetical protein
LVRPEIMLRHLAGHEGDIARQPVHFSGHPVISDSDLYRLLWRLHRMETEVDCAYHGEAVTARAGSVAALPSPPAPVRLRLRGHSATMKGMRPDTHTTLPVDPPIPT